MKQKTTFSFIALLLGFFPLFTQAHVKWFAHESVPVASYTVLSLPVLLGIGLAIAIVVLGIFLEKKLVVPHTTQRFIERIAPNILSIASIGFGIAFLIFSYQGFIFAPNLPAPIGILGTTMLVIQTMIGFMLLLGIYERVGGFLVLVLFTLGVAQYGTIEMLDTLEMVGFGLYAMIVGRPKWKMIETQLFQTTLHKIHSYGYPLLRVGTGLNLIVLGFTEKLLNPSLTAEFLQAYHWNFMKYIGVSDYWFGFMAGMVEILFGVFFLFGLITRTTTIVLALFLVTTLVLLGPVELIGHLPHFSIAIVLLVLGAGTKLVLVEHNRKIKTH